MIAILGGTFDPIHKGHLHIATRVFERLSVEQIQFMPCALPVHRQPPRASAEQRCDMIALEITGKPEFALNRIEVDRTGPSYSVDSLRAMHQLGFNRIALILGSDSFAGFSAWKQADKILKLAHLIVCHRPGTERDSNSYSAHRVESADQLESSQAGSILMLDVDAPDCASSELRERIAKRLNTDDCLGSAVADYIDQKKLYRKLDD